MNRLFFMILLLLTTLTGCHSVSSGKSVEVRLSQPFVLEPALDRPKAVYLQVTQIAPMPKSLESQIKKGLLKQGYRLVSNPEYAPIWVQVLLLQAGPSDEKTIACWIDQGYGTSLEQCSTADSARLAYSLVGDLQVSVRMGSTSEMKKKMTRRKNVPSSPQDYISTETVHWRRYQSRLVAQINQPAQSYNQAFSKMFSAFSQAITEVF